MDLHRFKQDLIGFKRDVNFRVQTLEEYIKNESDGFTKVKLNMKAELGAELVKLDVLTSRV